MDFAIHQGSQDLSMYVLTANCLQPSQRVERHFGPLTYVGTIEIEEELVGSLSIGPRSVTGDFEWVVDDAFAVRYVRALLADPQRALDSGYAGLMAKADDVGLLAPE